MNTIIPKIALGKLHGFGPVRIAQLISKMGGIEEIFTASLNEIYMQTGFAKSLLREIKREEALLFAEKEGQFCEKNGVSPLFFLDHNYPRRLKQCQDAPVMLYYKGTSELNQKKIVSIVGTRNETNYGQSILEELINSLKDQNVLVISGLAYGVDIHAHRLCIENKVETIAVLGHGLDRIYPNSHRTTATKMILNGGLLTEFPTNTNPDRENFPMRNRIIAGLSDATIVVESKESGGSMITADLANDYSRDVFAYPGDVNRVFSSGCNKLIKNQKAHLVTKASDILKIMNWETKPSGSHHSLDLCLSDVEQKIVDFLIKNGEVHSDSLCNALVLPPSQLSVILFNLTLKNVIQAAKGNRIQLMPY